MGARCLIRRARVDLTRPATLGPRESLKKYQSKLIIIDIRYPTHFTLRSNVYGQLKEHGQ